jgi:uncharacterized membrane protein
MPLWLIPIAYTVAGVACGLIVPRIELAYLAPYSRAISVASAQALLSAIASGMMALTGMVFAVAFVMAQFSAVAYSPRLALWLTRSPSLFHSLATLAWVDRAGSGVVPMFSVLSVGALLILSVLLFSSLVQRLRGLQISNVLQQVGNKGRQVIREMFQHLDERPEAEWKSGIVPADPAQLGPVALTLNYSGVPRAIAGLDVESLVRQAQQSEGVIVLACAVGDTLVEDTLLLRVHAAKGPLSRNELMRAVRLAPERTFEQDPKYPIRLLVDIAIKALSPAINDPTTAVPGTARPRCRLCQGPRRNPSAGLSDAHLGGLPDAGFR